MPRKAKSSQGKRVNVYLPPHSLKVANQIDNLSAFLQLALRIAPDIMAWDLLQQDDPEKYDTKRQMDDYVDAYNEKHPPDPLTAKRKDPQWQKNSPSKSELW